MEQNSQLQQEKREARRKRRIRNQILAYMAVILLIITTACGIVYGVKYVKENHQIKEQDKILERQDQLDQMLGEEDEIPEPSEVVTPEPEPEPELTPQEKLDELINARIAGMTLEDKVAGLFIVTPESITGVNTALKAGDGTKDALTRYAVGGIIYNRKNIKNAEQFKEMIETTKQYAIYPLFIAVSEESGTVGPLAQAGLGQKTGTAAGIAATGDTEAAYQAGTTIGSYLNEYGINLNLAPVADIRSVNRSVIGDRSFGSDAAEAGSYMTAVLRGLEGAGVNTCLKHFPGMGSTSQDTNKGLASTDRGADEFRENEFAVFRAGIDVGADMIMVSHMSAPSLSGDNTPCSMSSVVVTDILRNELNYDGVIITDAMNAGAISQYYGADQAAVLALRAGCDMILMPEDFEKAYNGVLAAVQNGEISEERVNDALRRIYRIKDADKLEELDN